MELIPYDADDVVAVETAAAIEREVVLADSPWERPPTLYRHTMRLRYGDDGEPGRHFLVRDGDADVGLVAIETTEHDNRDLAWLGVAIRPRARRRGFGSVALELALGECARAGRPSVLLYGWESEAMRAFAGRGGFSERGLEVRRLQKLEGTAAETDRFVSLHAEAAPHAVDYELVRITGYTPEELLPELAEVTAAINDAPLEGLEMEDDRFDAGRVRDYEHARIASGFRFRRVLARHRGTGALAGHSVVVVDSEQPAWGEQHDTAVLPAHRGHRLGLLLKTEMLIWLADEEPQLRRVLTENMASNRPMIAVNELLGQQVVGRQLLFQRQV